MIGSPQNRLRYYLQQLRSAYGRAEEDRRLRQRFPAARVGHNVKVVSPHLLELGPNAAIQSDTVLHCGGLDWSAGRGRISVGANSMISSSCVFWGAGEIDIAEALHCGPGCLLVSSVEDFERRAPNLQTPPHEFGKITIGRYVTMFAGVVITPGVTIGDGAVVAAGAVVVQDVPSRELWGGVPARRIRELPAWSE
ncbi:MAG: hypothetical protein WKF96_06940 [Solirubrobacteraceae bacterium]